jgi:hypothetical protein
MVKTYFTFGSDPLFPFGYDEYVTVCGESVADCVHKFMKKYPNPRLESEHIVNCAFFYDEKKWTEECACYYGPEPAEVIE